MCSVLDSMITPVRREGRRQRAPRAAESRFNQSSQMARGRSHPVSRVTADRGREPLLASKPAQGLVEVPWRLSFPADPLPCLGVVKAESGGV